MARSHRLILVAIAAASIWALMSAGAGAQSPDPASVNVETRLKAAVTPYGRVLNMRVSLSGEAANAMVAVHRIGRARTCDEIGAFLAPTLIASVAPWENEPSAMPGGAQMRDIDMPLPGGPSRLCVMAYLLSEVADEYGGDVILRRSEVFFQRQVDVAMPRPRALALVNRTLFRHRLLVPPWSREFVSGGGSANYFRFSYDDTVSVQVYQSVCACGAPTDARRLFARSSKPRTYAGRRWAARVDTNTGTVIGGQRIMRTTIAVLHRGYGYGHSSISVTYPESMRPTAERIARQALKMRVLRLG